MHATSTNQAYLAGIEQGLRTALDAIAREEEIDDLDDDDDFELVIQLSPHGVVELFEAQNHGDPAWGDTGDPYWELGGGD